MRRIYPLLMLLLLAACKHGQPLDGQKFFESIKQAGNTATQNSLVAAAKEAESEGNYRESAENYEQALKLAPGDRELRMALADSYRRSGNPDRAISLYDALLSEDAGFLAAKEGKGLALMAKGDYHTPALLFDQVIKVDRSRWKSLNALGILFSTRKLYNEAGQYFAEALKYQDNAGVMNNLGLAQALERHYDPAIGNISKAASLADKTSLDKKRLNLNLALAYASAGKLDEARDIVSQYSPNSRLDYDMSLYAHVASDRELADSYLHMALTEGKTLEDKAREVEQVANVQSAAGGEIERPWTIVPNKVKPVKKSVTKKKTKAKKPAPKIVTPKAVNKSDTDDALSKIIGANE